MKKYGRSYAYDIEVEAEDEEQAQTLIDSIADSIQWPDNGIGDANRPCNEIYEREEV